GIPANTLHLSRDFILANPAIFPDTVRAELNAVLSLAISDRAKTVEMQVILEEWFFGMDENMRQEVEENMTQAAERFLRERMRDLHRTGITAFDIRTLQHRANGTVPGRVL